MQTNKSKNPACYLRGGSFILSHERQMLTCVFAIKHKPSGQWLHIRRFDVDGKALLTPKQTKAWVSFQQQVVSQASCRAGDISTSDLIALQLNYLHETLPPSSGADYGSCYRVGKLVPTGEKQ